MFLCIFNYEYTELEASTGRIHTQNAHTHGRESTSNACTDVHIPCFVYMYMNVFYIYI